jgi:hypothetical protein
MFRLALVDAENAECLDVVAFARSDFESGDVIQQGPVGDLRVVNVLEPERDGQPPVLVVELAE